MRYRINKLQDKCDVSLKKKYNQETSGSISYFSLSNISSCWLAGSSLFFNADLKNKSKNKKQGWGQISMSHWQKPKQKPPRAPPRSQHPELAAKRPVLSLEGRFSHPFTVQGKIPSRKQTFVRFQLFKCMVLLIKGVFKPLLHCNLPANMGNH